MEKSTVKEQEQVKRNDIIDVTDKVPLGKAIPLSLQHLFAMFGASVLVPMLLGMDPAVVLLFNGIGTLLFAGITKRRVPAFLGSSFAFISPILSLKAQGLTMPQIQSGIVVSGLVFAGIGILVYFTGTKWIKKLFPPASMGAILMIIGLELASSAADNSGFPVGGANSPTLNMTWVTVAMITLVTVILCNVLLKGFLKIIPILLGVIVGYISAYFMGLVDFTAVSNASFFIIPDFRIMEFNSKAILTILPATFVVIAEHIGHVTVTSNIVGRDLCEDPGLHRTLMGDGFSTALSGFFGSVPTTTYGENIGVMAMTKVYSVYVICGAGILSIVLGFSGKLAELIRGIPTPVVGGISLLLFGMIATSGLRTFIDDKVDFSKSRNLILTSLILIIGLSGITVNIAGVELKGMGLATMVGLIINLAFMLFDKLGIMNEPAE